MESFGSAGRASEAVKTIIGPKVNPPLCKIIVRPLVGMSSKEWRLSARFHFKISEYFLHDYGRVEPDIRDEFWILQDDPYNSHEGDDYDCRTFHLSFSLLADYERSFELMGRPAFMFPLYRGTELQFGNGFQSSKCVIKETILVI